MLFSEVYSAYFNAVAGILQEAASGALSEKQMTKIAKEKAFSESFLEILSAINSEEWLIINKNKQTPIKKPPRMPLTTLQKRWLKSLLGDPRITLFNPDTTGLDDVAPLFSPEDFVYFDRYADGDPYTDARYIWVFGTILQALTQKRRLFITYYTRHNTPMASSHIPYMLEYSSKDDKFRLITGGKKNTGTINLTRITEIELLDFYDESEVMVPERRELCLTFELTDERNALERAMLHFSDCRKETRRTAERCYSVTLWYDPQDETEMLIRVLSFGPMVRVVQPESFIEKIKERLSKQKKLFEN
jgi:hypothetical protein